MTEYKLQEKLTTKKIEYDIKSQYGRHLVLQVTAVIVCVLIMVVGIIMIVKANQGEGSLGVLIAVIFFYSVPFLILIAIFGYSMYVLLYRYKKFKIGIDVYTGMLLRYRGLYYSADDYSSGELEGYYLGFSRFGKHRVFHLEEYYGWSENYKTEGRNLEKTLQKGDKVYVVLLGKRIQYIYSDKMFDLSETLIKERLIDDVELFKKEKQIEQDADEQ